jgi:hypothetical protein
MEDAPNPVIHRAKAAAYPMGPYKRLCHLEEITVQWGSDSLTVNYHMRKSSASGSCAENEDGFSGSTVPNHRAPIRSFSGIA